jgi:hypothetical protein
MLKPTLHDFSWNRITAAVDAVRERAVRATSALARENIPHAVAGGNAVAAWVSRVDIEAVRNTKDVDLLVQRDDLPRIIAVLQRVGFVYQQVNGIDLFLDGAEGSVRSALHLIFAEEKVRPDHLLAAPAVTRSEPGPEFTISSLASLVQMKLTAMRLKDQVHLLDLLEVGLLDESWLERVPVELRERLEQVMQQRDLER